jgi:hypothetical protein
MGAKGGPVADWRGNFRTAAAFTAVKKIRTRIVENMRGGGGGRMSVESVGCISER